MLSAHTNSFLSLLGMCALPKRLQYAVYWWVAGGHSGGTLELTQADCPASSAHDGGSTCSVRPDYKTYNVHETILAVNIYSLFLQVNAGLYGGYSISLNVDQ